MKIKLPKPFYTARVGEALSSLTNYVREASRIADEIKPVLSSDSPLKPDPDAVPPAPKLYTVDQYTKGSGSIAFSVRVTGLNLNPKNIHSFALIPALDLSDGRYSTNKFKNFSEGPPDSVEADFANPVPASGHKKYHYHAWVQDGFGQEDLLFNALKV